MHTAEELAAAFALFDVDGRGRLSHADLSNILTRPNSKVSRPITEAEVAQLIKEFDANGDGEIDISEFVELWSAIDPGSSSKPTTSVGSGHKPSTYQQSRWESKSKNTKLNSSASTSGGASSTGTHWEEVLRGQVPPVALLDAHWLASIAESGDRLQHRQLLPAEAFLSLDAVKCCGCPNHHLPIIACSYAWLSPAHPDPQCFQLRQLGKALRLLISEPAESSATLVGPGKTQRYAVFIDFCSLFQHPDPANGVFRDAEQDAAFKEGLRSLSGFYSSPATLVLRLTRLPEGYPSGYDLPDGANAAAYADRGWCYTESMWASLTKGSNNNIDLGRMRGHEASREALLQSCARSGARPAPLLPEQFELALAQRSFTNGKEDRPLVASLYEAAFHATFRNVHVLHYEDVGWGDTEAEQLARVLNAVAEPASGAGKWNRASRATPLNELYLGGNAIGDAGGAAIVGAAAGVRGLTWLSLRDNPGLGDGFFLALASTMDDKQCFRRLKEIRVQGCGASPSAKDSLVRACKNRSVAAQVEPKLSKTKSKTKSKSCKK